MNTKPLLSVLTCLFWASACGLYIQPPTKPFLELLHRPAPGNAEGKPRLDGLYHHIAVTSYNYPTDYLDGKPTRCVDTPYAERPIFFFGNGLMAYIDALCLDSAVFFQTLDLFGTAKDAYICDWGTYSIEKKTIKAAIYIDFSGAPFSAGTHRLVCYFEGYLKNRDTILGWQMVPPYPLLKNQVGNSSRFTRLLPPRDLYFKPSPIQKVLDPRKAWINEYRDLGKSN
jgi:hypothetical protein